MADPQRDFYSLQDIALLMGRDRAAVFRSAEGGAFGPPRLVNKQKFYSLAAAEKFYGKKTTAAQRLAINARPDERRAVRDRTVELVNVVRDFRDAQWRDCLAAQGIEKFEAPGEQP